MRVIDNVRVPVISFVIVSDELTVMLTDFEDDASNVSVELPERLSDTSRVLERVKELTVRDVDGDAVKVISFVNDGVGVSVSVFVFSSVRVPERDELGERLDSDEGVPYVGEPVKVDDSVADCGGVARVSVTEIVVDGEKVPRVGVTRNVFVVVGVAPLLEAVGSCVRERVPVKVIDGERADAVGSDESVGEGLGDLVSVTASLSLMEGVPVRRLSVNSCELDDVTEYDNDIVVDNELDGVSEGVAEPVRLSLTSADVESVGVPRVDVGERDRLCDCVTLPLREGLRHVKVTSLVLLNVADVE